MGDVTVTRSNPYQISIGSEPRSGSRKRKDADVAEKTTSRSGAYSEDIATVQREMLRDGFPVTVDGIDGPETKRIIEAYRQARADKQRQEAERAKADAATKAAEAAATAEREKAEAEKVKAQAALEKQKGDAAEAARKEREDREKREFERQETEAKRQADARKRLVETAANVVAVGTGIAAGSQIAKSIDSKDRKARSAEAKELDKIGGEVEKSMKALPKSRAKAAVAGNEARVRGGVKAADRILKPSALKLAGRLGLVKGGALITEGLYLRSGVAPTIESEEGRTAVQETGTAIAFAGTTTIANQLTNLATIEPADGKALARIESGKAFVAARDAGATTAEAAKAATAVANGEAKALATAAGKIAKKAIPFLGVLAGIGALVSTARAQGFVAAAREAVDLLDPTNGLAGKAIDAATGGNEPSSLKDLAKQQAAERKTQQTGTAVVPTESAGPHTQELSAEAPLQAPSGIIIDAGARGILDQRQAALMSEVARDFDGYYGGPMPAEQVRREAALGAANEGAHQVATSLSNRDGTSMPSTPARDVSPATLDSGNHLKGFQNPQNQLAAQLARASKGR